MIVRSPGVQVFSGAMIRLSLCAAALLAPLHSSALAAEDACGGLKVSGYTARRTSGPLVFQVAVSTEKERTEEVGGAGTVRIVDLATVAMFVLNPKTKSAVTVPPPPKPPKQEGAETFVDREPAKNGLVAVTMGLKTPKGKEWLFQMTCRPDGIWVERKSKTPQGFVSMQQSDIKIGPVPASQFEVPSDYNMVKLPQ
jgi:hypothetical protein